MKVVGLGTDDGRVLVIHRCWGSLTVRRRTTVTTDSASSVVVRSSALIRLIRGGVVNPCNGGVRLGLGPVHRTV